MSAVLVILSLYLTCAAAATGSHWGYTGLNGPNNWHKLFDNACSGLKQSPINIERQKAVYDPQLNEFALWHDPPRPGSYFDVTNNGHTIQIDTVGPFYVSNGGLPAVYSTVQFHFHWGHENDHGSEHLIDGRASPLELHIVSYNSDEFDMVTEAMVQPGGLAVLGVMYEIVDDDNPALEPIINAMNTVRDPGAKVKARIDAQPIKNFLPEDTTKYFRYNGSLTTPGCFESVIWTVFDQKRTISHRQMKMFRTLLQHKQREARKKRSVADQREVAAEEVLDEVGIKGKVLEELSLELQMEKRQKELAKQQEATIVKEYKMTHGMSEDEAVKLDDIPAAFIQEALYDNFRPVQPLNTRTVYSSFEIEAPQKPAKKIPWGYKGKKGPSNWHALFENSCLGLYQSPINIDREMTIYNPDINDFIFWYDPPAPNAEFYVFNNGHTVQVNTMGPFYVANGGLSSVYSTAQFHFHWGADNGMGSEHQVDGQSFPLELHVVNYDSVNYASISQAMIEPGGLAVLGVLFRVGEKDNEALEPIIQAMKAIRDPEDHAKVKIEAQAIKNFLPEDTSRFYRYNGSLTTPGCFESVIWTVFEERLTLSPRQMEEFRKLLQHRVVKEEMKKRDVSAQQREAAVDFLVEGGIWGDPKQERALTEELRKKRGITKMMQDEPAKTTTDEKADQGEENVEEITIEIVQNQLVNNFRPVQPLNNRLIYRTFTYEPRKEVRYVVRYSSQNNLAISSTAPSFIILFSCFIFTLFLSR
ncbi:uncharacterized protein LOC111135592 [Crassostrea virginica]